MEKNLTEGSVAKTLLSFSLPYLFSYLLQTLYGMADLFIIGQFDGVAVTTAVSIGSQVMHMLTVMIVGLAMGSTVMIGRAVGAGDRERVNEAVGNTVSLFLAVSAAATVLLLLGVRGIVQLILTPAEAAEGTVQYLTICFLGIPFITAYNILSAVFRGMGDSKSPMYFIAAACIANILLDYLFIGGLGMGAAGAALGTTLSQTISVAAALWVMRRRGTRIRFTVSSLRPRWEVMKGLLGIGVPVALQDGFIQMAFIVITVIANRRGLNDAAAVGVVEKIIGILFLVPSTMLSTVSALAAQNIGAGKYDRARRVLGYAVAASVSFGLISSVWMMFAAEPAVGLFTSDERVTVLGGQYMRGYVWDCIFAGIHFCFSGYFCACGLSGVSFLHNFISVVFVRVPLAYLASVCFAETLLPMGLASPAGSAASVAVCAGVYIWMRKRESGAGCAAEREAGA